MKDLDAVSVAVHMHLTQAGLHAVENDRRNIVAMRDYPTALWASTPDRNVRRHRIDASDLACAERDERSRRRKRDRLRNGSDRRGARSCTACGRPGPDVD